MDTVLGEFGGLKLHSSCQVQERAVIVICGSERREKDQRATFRSE